MEKDVRVVFVFVILVVCTDVSVSVSDSDKTSVRPLLRRLYSTPFLGWWCGTVWGFCTLLVFVSVVE